MENKLGFFKGLLRANAQVLGDIEGPVTSAKSGKMPLSLIDGKLVIWAVGSADKVLLKENVKEISFTKAETVNNLASGGGKSFTVNVYSLKTVEGINTLRTVAKFDEKVMEYLK